ncbi:MAG: hypothetical protein ACOX1Q_09955 [Eubacteriales bacterium]|jgi:hypothetical protein
MSVSDMNQFDQLSEQDLTSDQIKGVWNRVINASGRPLDKYEAIVPEILALTFAEKENPADTGQRKAIHREYNVYDDISKSIYGIECGQTEEPSPRLDEINNKQTEKPCLDQLKSESKSDPIHSSEKTPDKALLEDLIRSIINDQLEQSAFCRTIARYAPNRRAQRVLSLIANRDYSGARNLASALLSESGNLHFPRFNSSPQTVNFYRSSIREAWKNEVSLTADCASVSEKTENVPLIQTLLNAAREHAENAVELKRLIGKNLDFD